MSTQTLDTARDEAHIWAARHEDGLNAAERVDFEQWIATDVLHREAYAEAEMFFSGFAQMPSLAQARDAMPEPIEPAIASHAVLSGSVYSASKTGSIFAFAITAVFLCGAVMLGFGNGGPWSESRPDIAHFETPRGVIKTLDLPDKSRVILSPVTEAELLLQDEERRVRLVSGEAFFSVTSAPERPFFVETDRGTVAVTGTQFEVAARGDDYRIAVGEGSVRVSSKDLTKTATLSVGESIFLRSDGSLSGIEPVYPSELASWRSGRLTYIRAELRELVDDFNRYSENSLNVDEAAAGLIVTGTFNANNTEASLRSLQEALPIALERDGDSVTITAK
ncbi:MAG: FecR domain-containing protein [Pseudomonadota bacterium]